jgi:NAD(P)-dependent dehydrogenase (short-subunit alcohol dehydrogenase family)
VDWVSLDGRVAVITGGAGGIGFAVTQSLLELGATCVITDVLDERGREAARLLSGPTDVSFEHMDVTSSDEVAAVMAGVRRRHGRLDVLVTSAGVALHGDSLELPDADWDRVIETNLTGTFRCARESARQMIEAGNGGVIVAIGSISGEVANTPQAQTAYNASKGGVHVMVRCLAVEWAKHGIRVNAVAPGFVDTELTRDGVPAAWRARWSELTPAGRLGQPEEIGRMVGLIATDAASYVTGAVIAVDGGYLAW